MKNLLFLVSILFLGTLYSCSSDNANNIIEDQPSRNKQTVSFSLNNPSANSLSNMDETTPDIKKLIYAVYKTGDGILPGNEELVLTKEIEVVSNPVPAIDLDLSAGKYLLAVYASGRSDAKITTYEEAGKTVLKNSLIDGSSLTSSSEFYGTTNLEVVNQPVKATVDLQRIVGKVEIVIKDLANTPANITSVTPIMKSFTIAGNWITIVPSSMRMTSINASIFTLGNPNDNNDFSVFDALTLPRAKFANHNEDNPIVFYCLQTATNFSAENFRYTLPYLYIHLNPLNNDPANTVLITNQLTIYPNKVTRFTGSIVGENNQGFNMSVVDEWGNDTETVIVDKVL